MCMVSILCCWDTVKTQTMCTCEHNTQHTALPPARCRQHRRGAASLAGAAWLGRRGWAQPLPPVARLTPTSLLRTLQQPAGWLAQARAQPLRLRPCQKLVVSHWAAKGHGHARASAVFAGADQLLADRLCAAPHEAAALELRHHRWHPCLSPRRAQPLPLALLSQQAGPPQWALPRRG